MLEISNAHFERAGLRPKVKGGTYAERIAATLDLPVARVAQIMASGSKDADGFNLHVFDNMRGDHLEILRLLFHGDSFTDVALKIRRELNPQVTSRTVRTVGDNHLAAFKAAVAAGRVSVELSASTRQPVSRPRLKAGRKLGEPGRKEQARLKPQPEAAEKTPCKNKLAEGSATFSWPVSHPQPAIAGQAAEVPAARVPSWAVRPNFSQPVAGQIAPRLVDYDRLTGQPAGSGQ